MIFSIVVSISLATSHPLGSSILELNHCTDAILTENIDLMDFSTLPIPYCAPKRHLPLAAYRY